MLRALGVGSMYAAFMFSIGCKTTASDRVRRVVSEMDRVDIPCEIRDARAADLVELVVASRDDDGPLVSLADSVESRSMRSMGRLFAIRVITKAASRSDAAYRRIASWLSSRDTSGETRRWVANQVSFESREGSFSELQQAEFARRMVNVLLDREEEKGTRASFISDLTCISPDDPLLDKSLSECAFDADPVVRMACVTALGMRRVGDEKIKDQLKQLSREDPDRRVRRLAERWFGSD